MATNVQRALTHTLLFFCAVLTISYLSNFGLYYYERVSLYTSMSVF